MERARRRRAQNLVKRLRKRGPLTDLATDFLEVADLEPIGLSVERCYARALASCAGSITREHFISRSILRQFGSIDAGGIPWINRPGMRLGPEALTTKCLCQRHNNFLSPLDRLGGETFKKIGQFLKEAGGTTVVAGYMFERALLKHLFSLLGTGQIRHDGRTYNNEDLSEQWLECLFGREPFPEGTGLFVYLPVGAEIIGGRFMSAPLYLDGEIAGVHIDFGGPSFYLSFEKKERGFRADHPYYDQILYHPQELKHESGPRILLAW